MKKGNLILVGLIATIVLGGALYDKAHKIRYCKVIQEYDNWITVMHPNGEEYDFYDDRTTKFEYIEDTIIKVSFNELKLRERNYEINSGNPTPVFVDIKDR